jgi:hypothetical protein
MFERLSEPILAALVAGASIPDAHVGTAARCAR